MFIQPTELIKVQLEAVGIFVDLKMMDPSLWDQMRDANELYVSIDWLDDCIETLRAEETSASGSDSQQRPIKTRKQPGGTSS